MHCPIVANEGFILCALTALLDGCFLLALARAWPGQLGVMLESLPTLGLYTLGFIIHRAGPRQQLKPLPAFARNPADPRLFKKRKEILFLGGRVAMLGAGSPGPQRRVTTSPSIQARREAPRELPEEACCTPLGARMGVLRAHLPFLLGRVVGIMSKLNLCW